MPSLRPLQLKSRDGNVGSARRAGYGAADPLVGIHHDTDTETDEDEDEDEDAGSAPTVIFKELWRRKESRFKRASSLGKVAKGWRLMPVIGEAGMSGEGKSAFPSCEHADDNEGGSERGGGSLIFCDFHVFIFDIETSWSTRLFFFYEVY